MTAPSTADGTGDDQLERIARFVARVCLEVERGLRPPAHLLALMDPAHAPRTQRPPGLGRFAAGPVLDSHIGPAHLSRIDPRTAIANVVTRTEGDRSGALNLRLVSTQGRGRVAAVRRILPSTHRRLPRRTADGEPTQDRLAFTEEDHRLASAALAATGKRLAELDPATPGHVATQELVGHWTSKVAELDRELVTLQRQSRLRDHLATIARR